MEHTVTRVPSSKSENGSHSSAGSRVDHDSVPKVESATGSDANNSASDRDEKCVEFKDRPKVKQAGSIIFSEAIAQIEYVDSIRNGDFPKFVHGSFGRRLLPAPEGFDNGYTLSHADLPGSVSNSFDDDNPSSGTQNENPARSTSASPDKSGQPSPKGRFVLGAPLEEAQIASALASIQKATQSPTPRPFRWSPSSSRGSSESPKMGSALLLSKEQESSCSSKSIGQSGEEFQSHNSNTSYQSSGSGLSDGRSRPTGSKMFTLTLDVPSRPTSANKRSASPERLMKRRGRRSVSPRRPAIVSAHAAAAFGNLDALRKLVAGADFPNAGSFTCLHVASSHGQAGCVEWLLSSRAAMDADQRSKEGWTSLHLASRAGHTSCVELLLASQANPLSLDRYGRTPLHLACMQSSRECINALLSRVENRSEAVNQTDKDKWTTVHYAARSNNGDALTLLLDSLADPNVSDSEGWTPLHNCARNGQKHCAEILLRHGANMTAMTRLQQTPLHVASRSSKAKLMTLFVAMAERTSNAAIFSMKDVNGCTPAMLCNNKEMREILANSENAIKMGRVGSGRNLDLKRQESATTGGPVVMGCSKFCSIM